MVLKKIGINYWIKLYFNAENIFTQLFTSLIIIKNKKMEKLNNISPGEILLEEFLIPLNITQYRLSKELHIPPTRVAEIVKGNRRITADTALRLSSYFGNSAKFWLGIQDDYDIENENNSKKAEFNSIKKLELEKISA